MQLDVAKWLMLTDGEWVERLDYTFGRSLVEREWTMSEWLSLFFFLHGKQPAAITDHTVSDPEKEAKMIEGACVTDTMERPTSPKCYLQTFD